MPVKPKTFRLGNDKAPSVSFNTDNRPSASKRGYTSRWHKRTRVAQLKAEPLCRACAARGIVKAATIVDHIIPKKHGGTDNTDNLQSLCARCHNAKTARGL